METKTHFEYEIRHTACMGGTIIDASGYSGSTFPDARSAMEFAMEERVRYYRSVGTYPNYNVSLIINIFKVVTETKKVNQRQYRSVRNGKGIQTKNLNQRE